MMMMISYLFAESDHSSRTFQGLVGDVVGFELHKSNVIITLERPHLKMFLIKLGRN